MDFTNGSLYQDTYTIDWQRCTLKIAAMEIAPYVFINKMQQFDGIEVRAVKTIQEKMGYNIIFLNHTAKTWGLKNRDGNYSDLFGLLQKFQVDIVMGMWPTNFSVNWDFDMTFGYFVDALVWLVPKSSLQTPWKSISSIFNVNLWILLVTMVIIQGVLWKGISFVLDHEENLVFTKLKNCLIFSLAVIFNMSINKHPSTFSLRIIFSSWVYASLIIVTIYQSKLIASLTRPSYEFQISNIQELLSSKLSFGGNINLKNLYNNSLNPYEKIISENLEICDLSLKCINRTAFQKDFALIKSELPSKFLIIKYFTNPDGTPMIYIFKNKIMFHFVATVFSPNHPIFNSFDTYLLHMFEMGFFLKWLQDVKFDEMKSFNFEDNKIFKLTFANMAMPFVILFIGLGIATAVYIFECAFSKLINNIKLKTQT